MYTGATNSASLGAAYRAKHGACMLFVFFLKLSTSFFEGLLSDELSFADVVASAPPYELSARPQGDNHQRVCVV